MSMSPSWVVLVIITCLAKVPGRPVVLGLISEVGSTVTKNCTYELPYKPHSPFPNCKPGCPDLSPAPPGAPLLTNVYAHLETALEQTCTDTLIGCAYRAAGVGNFTHFGFIAEAVAGLFTGDVDSRILEAWQINLTGGLVEQWQRGYGRKVSPGDSDWCPPDFVKQRATWIGDLQIAWRTHLVAYNVTTGALWANQVHNKPKFEGIVQAICDKLGDDDGSHEDAVLKWLQYPTRLASGMNGSLATVV